MYTVIEGTNINFFTKMVNEKLTEGYILVGGVSISFVYNSNSSTPVEKHYAQALVKK